jgi:hypothetical protein
VEQSAVSEQLDHPLGLCAVLYELEDRSACVNRVARHLLRLEIHDTITFVHQHPGSISAEVADAA